MMKTSNFIFDNYGGSVDQNSVYNYKRYPINLEADILLGTIGYDKTISTDSDFRQMPLQKKKKLLYK